MRAYYIDGGLYALEGFELNGGRQRVCLPFINFYARCLCLLPLALGFGSGSGSGLGLFVLPADFYSLFVALRSLAQ